jgi:hypothetical protein
MARIKPLAAGSLINQDWSRILSKVYPDDTSINRPLPPLMAIAAFWNVAELKMDVFWCLADDGCFADLARCARVHSTWAEIALDVLWRGDSPPSSLVAYKRGHRWNRKRNWQMPEAIAKLPRARRQRYASKVSTL